MTDRLHGVIPPLVTPLTWERDVDTDSLRRLIDHLITGGVHGLFVLGSSGETSGLTCAQRRAVIETAIDAAAGSVPVLAGVIAPGTSSVIEEAKVAESLGVDYLVVTPPFYSHPSDDEIVEHFRMVHAAVSTPVMAYSIPTNMNTSLNKSVVVRLAKEKLAVGLKDSGRNDANFRQTVMAVREFEDFACFTGSESTVDFALYAGAEGCVPGLGNIDPAGYVRLYDAATAGDFATARREQERLVRLDAVRRQGKRPELGGTSGTIGGYKTALKALGVIDTNMVCAPIHPLNADEEARIREILVSLDLVN